MKLLVCLVAVLLIANCYSSPILGRILRKRNLIRGNVTGAGGILGTILGGGEYNSQQSQTRRAPSPAPAPAPTPVINVHVQNIYNKQNNKNINNNNQIDSINNNIVNNDVNVQQDITNNAISNEYNNKEINNKLVNNNYGEAYSEVPAQQGRVGGYQPKPRYAAGYENEREQSYKSRDAIQAEREREYSDVARSQGNYQSY